MTDTKQSYKEPVASQMTPGDARDKPEWRDYLSFGFTAEHVPELCRMILDEELFRADGESDEVWPRSAGAPHMPAFRSSPLHWPIWRVARG